VPGGDELPTQNAQRRRPPPHPGPLPSRMGAARTSGSGVGCSAFDIRGVFGAATHAATRHPETLRMLAHRPARVPGTLTASGFLAPSHERILGAATYAARCPHATRRRRRRGTSVVDRRWAESPPPGTTHQSPLTAEYPPTPRLRRASEHDYECEYEGIFGAVGLFGALARPHARADVCQLRAFVGRRTVHPSPAEQIPPLDVLPARGPRRSASPVSARA
jgi:hypothetical protein